MRQRDWLTWMLGRLGHPLISAAHHRMDTCGTGNGTVFAIATALRLWPTMITLRHRAGSRVLPVSANANVSYGCCEPGVRMHVVWGIASFSGPQVISEAAVEALSAVLADCPNLCEIQFKSVLRGQDYHVPFHSHSLGPHVRRSGGHWLGQLGRAPGGTFAH